MAETRPTPGPWSIFDMSETTAVFGPKEGARQNEVIHWMGFDGSDYQKERVANGRLIVSSCNAVQSLAEKIGADPVALAKKLEDGGLVELHRALSLHVKYEQTPTDRGGKHGPKGKAWTRFVKARDAILARLGGEG